MLIGVKHVHVPKNIWLKFENIIVNYKYFTIYTFIRKGLQYVSSYYREGSDFVIN